MKQQMHEEDAVRNKLFQYRRNNMIYFNNDKYFVEYKIYIASHTKNTSKKEFHLKNRVKELGKYI